MSYLEDLYKKGGAKSIGAPLNSKDQEDCKLLPSLSKDQCRVFDADIEFRKLQREKLKLRLIECLRNKNTGPLNETRLEQDAWRKISCRGGENNILFDEAGFTKNEKYILTWLNTYEGLFKRLKEQGLDGSVENQHLRTLCPVTWKTLETIFAHKLNYRKFDERKQPD
jgi:hypothetical protein